MSKRDTGLKGFMVYHGEKIAALAVFVFAAVFFALGARIDKIDSSINPASLSQLVKDAEAHLTPDEEKNWEFLPKKGRNSRNFKREKLEIVEIRNF